MVQAEVIVSTKDLVILVKGSISGNLFMEISMVKVWVPINSPTMVGLIYRLALDPVWVNAKGEVEIKVNPLPPGLSRASTWALGVVKEYFKGVQLPTLAVK